MGTFVSPICHQRVFPRAWASHTLFPCPETAITTNIYSHIFATRKPFHAQMILCWPMIILKFKLSYMTTCLAKFHFWLRLFQNITLLSNTLAYKTNLVSSPPEELNLYSGPWQYKLHMMVATNATQTNVLPPIFCTNHCGMDIQCISDICCEKHLLARGTNLYKGPPFYMTNPAHMPQAIHCAFCLPYRHVTIQGAGVLGWSLKRMITTYKTIERLV